MNTAEKIKGLKEDRGAKMKEADALLDKAEAENRGFTPEEKTKFDALNKEADAITERIKNLEEKEKRELDGAVNIVSSGNTSAANKRGEEGEKANMHAQWSWKRALNSRFPGGKLDGAELELDQEERKAVIEGGMGEISFHPNSVMAPAAVLAKRNVQRRDMDATTDTAAPNNEGSFTIQTDVKDIVDVFLPEMVLGKLPITKFSNLRGNLQFPQAQTAQSAGWNTENGTATEKSPKFAKLNLSPKRLAAYVQMSNQLLIQSESNISSFVRRFLVSASAIEFEKAALKGGGSNEPVGILGATSNYTSVYAGGAINNGVNASGAAPIWQDMVNLVASPKYVNSPDGQAFVTSPQLKAKLQITGRQSAGVEGNFILRDWNSGVNGYPMYGTTNLPNTFSKGACSTILGAFIFGDFTNFATASWGGMEIGVDPYVNMKEALTNVVLNTYMDCGVLNPNAFAAGIDFRWF